VLSQDFATLGVFKPFFDKIDFSSVHWKGNLLPVPGELWNSAHDSAEWSTILGIESILVLDSWLTIGHVLLARLTISGQSGIVTR
jgi:hypothetical protein